MLYIIYRAFFFIFLSNFYLGIDKLIKNKQTIIQCYYERRGKSRGVPIGYTTYTPYTLKLFLKYNGYTTYTLTQTIQKDKIRILLKNLK